MSHRLSLASLTAWAMLLVSASASAQTQSPYQFDATCAPRTEHPSLKRAPNVLFILDRSGSMAGTKWTTARNVMFDVINASHRFGPCNAMNTSGCDDILIGFGHFSGSSSIVRQPAEDTRDDIFNWLNNNSPSGGTYTGTAAQRINQSPPLSDPDRVGIGVIITDGAPTNYSTINQVRTELCAARARGIPTYMVGFGSGSNPRMNSYMAAVGGTGECCSGAGCTYQPNQLIDPCAVSTSTIVPSNWTESTTAGLNSGYSCRGSLEATSGQALKNALLAIVGQASCTFRLDVPANYPAGEGADPDPRATYVAMNHLTLGPDLEVPFADPANPNAFRDYLVNVRGVDPGLAAPLTGQGWVWADQTRTSVRFTDGLCAEIAANRVAVTETQLACLCANTGEACDVPCDGGYDDNSYCDNGSKAGRCKPGVVICDYGQESCQQLYGRMPEICNGLDDNCNGMVDDLASSDPARPYSPDHTPWKGQGDQPLPLKPNASSAEDTVDLFCGFKNDTCRCGGLRDSLGEPPVQNQPEWALFMDTWSASCVCAAGLSPELEEDLGADAERSDDLNAADDAEALGCQAAGAAPSLAPLLLVAFGALLGRRRRRA